MWIIFDFDKKLSVISYADQAVMITSLFEKEFFFWNWDLVKGIEAFQNETHLK